MRVVLTGPAQHFWERSRTYAPEAWRVFQGVAEQIPVLRDADEWAAWDELGDKVVHVELREWADALVLAPLSANTLAKLANGLCDNLLVRSLLFVADRSNHRRLHPFIPHSGPSPIPCPTDQTSVVRAWDVRKPVLVCPAMNTHMWEHPFTQRHLAVLTRELGYKVLEPVAKLLACGDRGKGGLAAVDDIVAATRALLPKEGEGGGDGGS